VTNVKIIENTTGNSEFEEEILRKCECGNLTPYLKVK
jgi:hypothetical protein